MRRKRVETYFALYLTAVIAFLVVASERDKVEAQLRRKNEEILAAFLRSAPVEPERDTLYWNVDADDRTGILRPRGRSLRTFVRIRDIRDEDSVSMTLASLSYEGAALTDTSLVRILEAVPEPGAAQMAIQCPIDCFFPKTGTYDVSLSLRTQRIHVMPNGELRYNNFIFAADLISRERRDQVERSSVRFAVVVQDTSVPYPVAVQQIAIQSARSKIVSAIGFEETNEIFMNLQGLNPSLRVVSGPGSIEQRPTDGGGVKYLWRGQVQAKIDSVIVEARVSRNAGGKDVARATFFVMPNEPYLVNPLPAAAYAGEEFEMSVQVEGLNNSALYSWTLSANGEKRAAGSGPTIRFPVPAKLEGADLLVNALYDGKTYRCVNRTNRKGSESNFPIRIQKPPARIFFDPPGEVYALNVFSFDAVRYGRRKFEKPIPFNEVEVRVINDRGITIPVELSMNQEGNYVFRFQEPNRFIRNTQDVTINIRAAEATVQEIVRIIKNK